MTSRVAQWALAACVALAFGAAASASSIVIYNTGVDGNGVVLPNGTTPDPHYTLTSVPSGSTTDTLVRSGATGFPFPAWLADNGASRWIKPNNEGGAICDFCSDPEGDYVYRTTFDLTGSDPATAILTGRWVTDDLGSEVFINGNPTGIVSNGSPQPYQQWTTFTIDSGFVAGINYLDFEVHNTAGFGNPTGLRVEFFPIPEPASLLLVGAGLAALASARRRRARSRSVTQPG